LRRAQKALSAAEGEGGMATAARVFMHDAMDRIERQARTALAAAATGDALLTQLAVLRRLAKHSRLDTITMRRHVADAVLEQDRYPFHER
jgi:hypothetical protein